MLDVYSLRELTTLAEMAAQYPLVQQRNPTLTAKAYETMLPDMLLYCGRYIEMDNVVVDAVHRSAGIGKVLADWIVEKGRAEGCRVAMLDVYVHNKEAHRLYFREGYTILGFHMQRTLEAS